MSTDYDFQERDNGYCLARKKIKLENIKEGDFAILHLETLIVMEFASKYLKKCTYYPGEGLLISEDQDFKDMDEKAFRLWVKLEYGGG